MTEYERLKKRDELHQELMKFLTDNYDLFSNEIGIDTNQYNDQEKLIFNERNNLLNQLHKLEVNSYIELWSSRTVEQIKKEIEQLNNDKNISLKNKTDKSIEIAAQLFRMQEDLKEILEKKLKVD